MITTSELIDWLRAEEEDAPVIESLLAAAIAHVENETGTSFGMPSEQVQSITWNGWPMELRGDPAGAVTLEQWNGSAWEAVGTGNFYVDGAFIRPAGNWRFTEPWPRFRATYTTGWTEGLQPEPVKLAVKMLVAHWYENREAVSHGLNVPHEVPMAVDRLLAPYRRVVI